MRTVSDDEDGGVRQNGVSGDDLGCAPTVVPRDRRPRVVRSGLVTCRYVELHIPRRP